MGETVTLAFRVPPKKAAALEKLAQSTERPKAWLLEQALDEYLLEQAWQIEAIEKGIADVEAGRTIPHERVREWLLSWGRRTSSIHPYENRLVRGGRSRHA